MNTPLFFLISTPEGQGQFFEGQCWIDYLLNDSTIDELTNGLQFFQYAIIDVAF